MRLKCNYVKNLLSDYLDGILPENQTVVISQHLRHCRVCQRELETLNKTTQLLKFYIEKSPPDGYFQQLWPNLKYLVECRNNCNQLSLQWLVTLLILKFKGFKAGLLAKCEELKTTLNGQWYKVLVKCAIVACFVLISIFIDRTYIRPSHKVVSEFIRNSFYSQGTYNSEFFIQPKRNDNRNTSFRSKDVFGYQGKAINLVKEENRENVLNTLPVLHGKVGAIDIDLHPVSFKNGILTLVVNLAEVNDIPEEQLLIANQQSYFNSMGYWSEVKQLPHSLELPEVPKVENHESLGSNKRPKFESWLANLLTDVTLPTLSIADASGIENVATGKISH
ncbi:hypothetical protein FJZ31_25445 [Candidatus Poribacteria bacterium]|nr:hypothetical protein [Candidatus Poribacteria bacterium]